MQRELDPKYHMWNRLIPGLEKFSGGYRKTMKIAYANNRGRLLQDFNPMPEDELKAMQTTSINDVYTQTCGLTFAPLPAPKMNVTATEVQVMTRDCWKVLNTPMKKGKKMYDDFDDCDCCTPSTKTDEQTKREYLAQRLYEIDRTKRQDTRKTFYMDADQPGTLKELVEKIQAGTFTLDKKHEASYAGCIYSIDWHDPAHPADETGYRAARDAFKKLKTETQDQIKIADVADGLKALQALEAWTPTGAAN